MLNSLSHASKNFRGCYVTKRTSKAARALNESELIACLFKTLKRGLERSFFKKFSPDYCFCFLRNGSYITTLIITFALFSCSRNHRNSNKTPYDKVLTYQNKVAPMSMLQNVVIFRPNDFSGNPNAAQEMYSKIKDRFRILGYNVLSMKRVEKLAGRLGVAAKALFHPPYKRIAVQRLEVSAVVNSSLVDYRCAENTMCSFVLLVQANELRDGMIVWSGSVAFKQVVKNNTKIFDEQLNRTLKTIPPFRGKAPKHPLEMGSQ